VSVFLTVYRGGRSALTARIECGKDTDSVTLAPYPGPSVFGFETDALRRVAAISVHTSPLAALGGRDAGGMNVYIRELSCHTARFGLPVDIFTRRTDPDAPEIIEICDGVSLINITAGPAAPVDKNELFTYLPDFAEQAALYSLRWGVRYDVVHAHYWLSGYVAQLLKRYWDAPFIQMFHTTAHMKNAVVSNGQRETPLRSRIERNLVDLADSIVAANPDERADLIWRQHAHADKICTIPPGVDMTLFESLDRAESRVAVGLENDRPIVLFVGRIDPIKGIDVLLQAATKLPDDQSSPLFVFVGGDLDSAGEPAGPLAQIAAQARELGIANSCRFVGSQPQDRLPLFYSAADVVAVPSRYESFGLVAVEAMACGTPVVASRVGGLTFTIDDEETGLLVPYGDPDALAEGLRKLLENQPIRERMGAMAQIAAKRFAWETVATSVLGLYDRLASGRRANLCCEEEIFA
jgi:D-inositol-3-phosphate glycosyltransferase